ncbi:MAG: hypothetical protein JOY92_10015 [Verrucomicrobia bacterium]|nr:hypothetical protein [Verrucomicrobiota bacterium]
MEPEKPEPQLSAQERLARDAQREAALLRNILWFTLWTLVALIPTMLLLLVEMSTLWRVITGILCALFWLLTLRGMFRLTGLLDAGSRPISLNPFHAGKEADKDEKRR